jgi:NAD(P)H-dependent FMN reductase
MTKISVIIGSTRHGRFGERPAAWIFRHLQKRSDIEVNLLDLRDYPMPFFDEPVSPAKPGHTPFENEAVLRWTDAVGAADGFVIVTPEYNFSCPAVLKNALDYVYDEWNRKPVAFVSYGSVGGARAVQQLREMAVELQMAPVRRAVHIPVNTPIAHHQGGDVDPLLDELEPLADLMIEDLLWWTAALNAARAIAA